MHRARKTSAYLILLAALFVSAEGCSDKKPSPDAFRSSITQTVPGYKIKDLRCESFADKSQEGSGRANCQGVLAIEGDLYAVMPTNEVESLLIAAGIPSEGGEYFRTRHSKSIFIQTVSAGAQVPFTADCAYLGEVDGPRVSCSPNFSRFEGQPLGMLGQDAIVKDSPEYTSYINEVMSDYRRLDAAYQTVKTGIEQFFAVGRTLFATNPYTNGAIVRARMTSPLVWSGARGFLGHQAEFAFETKYVDLRDNPSSTFCGYAKGEPADDLRIAGNIGISPRGNSSDESDVSFNANLYLMNRSLLFKNNFQSCGNSLNWNGNNWKGSWGTVELKSN